MILFQVCRDVNPKTYLVSAPADVDKEWFSGIQTIGICGATSTPMWLMEEIAREIGQMTS